MTPTIYTLTRERLEKALELIDREAKRAWELHDGEVREAEAEGKKLTSSHWDSYAQGVEFAAIEIRAALGMEESDVQAQDE